jgi:hypothetical protein
LARGASTPNDFQDEPSSSARATMQSLMSLLQDFAHCWRATAMGRSKYPAAALTDARQAVSYAREIAQIGPRVGLFTSSVWASKRFVGRIRGRWGFVADCFGNPTRIPAIAGSDEGCNRPVGVENHGDAYWDRFSRAIAEVIDVSAVQGHATRLDGTHPPLEHT